MSGGIFAALAVSLLLTLALETGFFFIVGKRNKKDLLLSAAANIVTNPVVVLLFWILMLYTSLNRIVVIISLELFAVFAEGYYYRKYGRDFKRPYLYSAAANAFSFGMGALLQQII